MSCRRFKSGAHALVVAGFVVACGAPSEQLPTPPPDPTERLVTIERPDFDRLEPAVQDQLSRIYDSLQQAIDRPDADDASLASAYGDTGMHFLAYGFVTAAEGCLRNARSLAPEDPNWPYYLAEIQRQRGEVRSSAELYRRSLELDADYAAGWVRLGRLQLEDDRVEQARTSFERALALEPQSAAAMVGLGRIDLREGRYTRAVERFEAARELAPESGNLHYHLAMAYRGLGNLERAEQHLNLRTDVKVGVSDPRMERVQQLTVGAKFYQQQGELLGREGRYSEAVPVLRKAVASDPADPLGHYYLGIALSKSGDPDGALASFRKALELAPDDEQVHLFTGWILAAQGRDREAVESFKQALRAQPGMVRAQLQLAAALQRLGEQAEALESYRQVIELDPANGVARLGRAFALIRLGRWAEARDALEDDTTALPDQPVFRHSLARVLAAAPDDAVRDGIRALQLAEELSQTMKSIELGQTVAMALAEQGRFDEATSWQRDLIRLAEPSGHTDLLNRMAAHLARYEQRQPCRTPWPDDAPVFTPPPPTVQHAFP